MNSTGFLDEGDCNMEPGDTVVDKDGNVGTILSIQNTPVGYWVSYIDEVFYIRNNFEKALTKL